MAAAAGMTALIWISSPAAVLAGVCLFGAGFGIIQSATYALMMDRVPASGYGEASSLWNLAYDAGYGAGPLVFGALTMHSSFSVCFGIAAALAFAGTWPAWRDWSRSTRSCDYRKALRTVSATCRCQPSAGRDRPVPRARHRRRACCRPAGVPRWRRRAR